MFEHAGVGNNYSRIIDTLIQPLFIAKSNKDERVHNYHRKYKEKERYLIVVVKYLNGEGYIITCHYSKRIKK